RIAVLQGAMIRRPHRLLRLVCPALLVVFFCLGSRGARAAPPPPVGVLVPPAAFEDTHIVLVWEKPTGYSAIAGYNVYKNGALVANLPKTQLWYDFTGLTANTTYTLKVRSRDSTGTESGDSSLVNQSTTATPAVVFVHSFA